MSSEMEEHYMNEKIGVVGELSERMKQLEPDAYKNRRDDEEFPPPPPVFQTYAEQLSGKDIVDDDDDFPPPPTPLQLGLCHVCSEEVQSGGCKALGKTFHIDCFKCTNCKKQLEEKFFSMEEQPLCEACYKEITCPVCSVCGNLVDGDGVIMKENEKNESFRTNGKDRKVYHSHCLTCSYCTNTIDGKFFTQDGKLVCNVCAADQIEDKTCDICEKEIDGDCLVSNGKHFHHDCMKCSICGDSLSGTYFTFEDKLICEKDYKDTQKSCSECGNIISGPYYTLDNDKVVCEVDYKKMLGNCERCGKVVEGKILKVSGGFYHPDCFTCMICKESLIGVKFSLDDDKNVYCQEDYQRKHAATCSACREPIVPKKGETSAARLRALGRDFHPECFKCEDCSMVLDSRINGSECYPVDNRPLCVTCSRKRQS